MHILARLVFVIAARSVIRAAWARWAQGPHRSTPGAPVVHPMPPPRPPRSGADDIEGPADDYRRPR
jgi:hypothetical protein